MPVNLIVQAVTQAVTLAIRNALYVSIAMVFLIAGLALILFGLIVADYVLTWVGM